MIQKREQRGASLTLNKIHPAALVIATWFNCRIVLVCLLSPCKVFMVCCSIRCVAGPNHDPYIDEFDLFGYSDCVLCYDQPKSDSSSFHLNVVRRSIHLNAFCSRYPEHVVAPYQDLSQRTCLFAIDKLLCIVQLDVHVRVYTDQHALILGLSPLQAYNDFLVDPGAQLVDIERADSRYLQRLQ